MHRIRNEDAQTIAEYGLVLALVSVAGALLLTTLGGEIAGYLGSFVSFITSL